MNRPVRRIAPRPVEALESRNLLSATRPAGPAAADDTYAVATDRALDVAAPGILANDPGDAGLAPVLVAAPVHGSLSLRGDGSFTYTPRPGYYGYDDFTYRDSDGVAVGNVAVVNINVVAPPVSLSDHYTARSGSALTVGAASGVLANDRDINSIFVPGPNPPGRLTLTAAIVSGPAHGSLGFGPDGSFTYRAETRYAGRDGFSYRATNGIAAGVVTTVDLAVKAPANDYDGDGRSDVAVYAPGDGTYHIKPSGGGPDRVTQFGAPGDGQSIPAPGDYDGDGRTDLAVYMPGAGRFAYRPSGGGPDVILPFGSPGAGQSIPAPGDYDGDGRADLAVYLTGPGALAVRPSSGGPDRIIPFGTPGAGQSVPAPGDYDGDGRADPAVYLPGTGEFAYRPSGGGPDVFAAFGAPGAGQSIPVPGDYSGSGRDELAVYMPETAVFAYRPGLGGADVVQQFGIPGAGRSLPAAGDYAGLGRDQVAVYVPDTGTFAIRSGAGPDWLVDSGTAGDRAAVPVTAVDVALALITPGGPAVRGAKKAGGRGY